MEEVLKTIQHITQRYGKDVLLEKRFLNIFNDLYPNRMDKEVHALLSCMYEKGYLKQILKAKKRSLKKEVTLISNSLVKDGHAEKDVQQLLRAIIVGIGVATKQEYSDILNGGDTHKQSHSSIGSTFSNIVKTITHYALLFLLLAMISAIPYLYILSLCILKQFLTIAINIAFCIVSAIISNKIINKSIRTWSPFQKGCLYGLIFCLFVPLTLFPLLTYIYKGSGLFYYWCSNYAENLTDEGAMEGVLVMMGSLTFGIIVFLIYLGFEINDNEQGEAYKHKIKRGIVSAIICYANCICATIAIPYFQKKAEFGAYNIKSKELKQNRQKVNKSLSFNGIQLGDSFEKCLSVARIKSNDIKLMSGKEGAKLRYSDYYVGIDNTDNPLIIDNTDYSLIVDSVITAKTSWDNQYVDIYIYFNKGVNVAIKVTNYKDPIPLYIKRYGKPEDIIPKLDYDETLRSKVENNQFLYKGDGYLSCKWTFKNSIIFINKDTQDILYFNRNCEKIYAEHELSNMQRI